MTGLKFDSGKTQYHLMPPNALEEICKVLMFGAAKYSENNWRIVDDANTRYYNAGMRHLQAWLQGEKLDQESGLPHLAHALCCFTFLLELDK
ncbi:MAG: hypothetical protein E6R03_14605 [Hyphomicrobiaceae bacterium]|nr:MAG: hypothetical protein E6R03_14605 [Hyphomicrobiaceae bacterium]